MSIVSWAEERTRAMTMWDVGFLKISAMLFGMVVGAYWGTFVLRHLWWFVVPMCVLGGRSGYRWLTARKITAEEG